MSKRTLRRRHLAQKTKFSGFTNFQGKWRATDLPNPVRVNMELYSIAIISKPIIAKIEMKRNFFLEFETYFKI